MMKNISLVLVGMMVLFSCSKEKRSINKIAGEWMISSIYENDTLIYEKDSTFESSIVDPLETLTFSVNEEDYQGKHELIQMYMDSSHLFDYDMSNDGEELTTIISYSRLWPIYDVNLNVTYKDTVIYDTTVYEIIKLKAKDLSLKFMTKDSVEYLKQYRRE